MQLLIKFQPEVLARFAVLFVQPISHLTTRYRRQQSSRESDVAHRETHLCQFLSELLQLGIVIRLDDIVMAIKLVEIQRLLDHLAVLLQARTAFL